LNSRPIKEAISFSEEKLKKNALFDSQRLFYDLYCLLPGQHQKVHAHEGSDKVYYVLEGTGRFTVGSEEQDLPGGHAVIARAGEPHGVRNASGENLVLLVTMAPRPSLLYWIPCRPAKPPSRRTCSSSRRPRREPSRS
jgi:mannose-6-phosphate isomerase-like protein (cupin superfamily)